MIGGVDTAAQPVPFGAADRLDNVTAVFADSAATLSGLVLGDNRQPAAEYFVLLFPVARRITVRERQPLTLDFDLIGRTR